MCVDFSDGSVISKSAKVTASLKMERPIIRLIRGIQTK